MLVGPNDTAVGGGGPGLPRPTWLPDLVPTDLYRLAAALLLLAVAYYLSKVARQVFGRRVARRFRRPSVTRTVLRGIQGIVVLLAAFVALTFLGVEIGDLAISLSVFSAVLGFILAPIIASVVNGLFVLSERPYEIGDMIHLSDVDTHGFIEDITLRYTKIFTLDNTFLIVPNGSIRDRDVVNLSAEDPRTRLSLDVLVTYESDVAAARKAIEEAARLVDNVIGGGPDIRIGGARYPAAPTCYVESYADHGVNLRLRYWVSEPYRLLTARSNVQENLWELLADEDVTIAYPHQHLVFDDTSGELQVAMRDGAPDGTEVGNARPRSRSQTGDGRGRHEPAEDESAEDEPAEDEPAE